MLYPEIISDFDNKNERNTLTSKVDNIPINDDKSNPIVSFSGYESLIL